MDMAIDTILSGDQSPIKGCAVGTFVSIVSITRHLSIGNTQNTKRFNYNLILLLNYEKTVEKQQKTVRFNEKLIYLLIFLAIMVVCNDHNPHTFVLILPGNRLTPSCRPPRTRTARRTTPMPPSLASRAATLIHRCRRRCHPRYQPFMLANASVSELSTCAARLTHIPLFIPFLARSP